MDYSIPTVILILALEAVLAYYLLRRTGMLSSDFLRILSVILIVAAIALRSLPLSYRTADYNMYLSLWVEHYRNSSGLAALDSIVGDYNVPYNVFLALISYLPISDLYLIKLLSIAFDVVLAYSGMRLLSHFTDSDKKKLTCFFVILFLPTVFLNSSMRAQCDSIYISIALLGICLALEDKPHLSMLCIAVSFAIKLQTVFIMPIYAVLWMRGKFNWKHFIIFPITYLILVSPAMIAGADFWDVMLIYVNQGAGSSWLNYNSSSIFALFDGISHRSSAIRALLAAALFLLVVSFSFFKHKIRISRRQLLIALAAAAVILPLCYLIFQIWLSFMSVIGVAVIVAAAYVLAILAFCWFFRKKLDDRLTLVVAILFTAGIPLLLPCMHDRYFYFADILTIVSAFIMTGMLPSAILTPLSSMVSYCRYLFYATILAEIPLFCGTIGFIIALGMDVNMLISLVIDSIKCPALPDTQRE